MSNKTIIFEDKKINKCNFYKSKKLFNLHDLDVNKILVSKNNFVAPLREKCVIKTIFI